MATKEKNQENCYTKAASDEPVFTLRAQDQLAPEIVRDWAFRARHAGVNSDKVVEALTVADQMEDWQVANQSKIPD